VTATATSPTANAESPGRRRSGVERHFVGALVGASLLGLAIRLMNVYWWRPTTDRAGYLG
jgi:hypothetical protein